AREHQPEDIMKFRTTLLALSLFAAAGIISGGSAQAAEITVLLNQATESGVRELAAAFEKASGHKVIVSFQGGPALNQKVNAGEGDLASLGLAQLDDFIKSGKVVAGSVVRDGRVGNGGAVKSGEPKPESR